MPDLGEMGVQSAATGTRKDGEKQQRKHGKAKEKSRNGPREQQDSWSTVFSKSLTVEPKPLQTTDFFCSFGSTGAPSLILIECKLLVVLLFQR